MIKENIAAGRQTEKIKQIESRTCSRLRHMRMDEDHKILFFIMLET